MAFPVTFAGLTTAQMASLDQMFQIVGNIGAIPCTAAGTNLITLTPLASITPAVNAYANYLQFSFVAPNTSTGAVMIQVGSLAALPVYLPTGTQANSGGIAGSAFYVVAFNLNLNGGGGGWQIIAGPTVAVNTALTTGRNRIINGGMDTDQRNEGTAVSILPQNSAFIADQTQCFFSGLTNITAQRVAVTGLAGFVYGTQVSILSGNAGVGAQDYLVLLQNAEGINVADLSFGTAVAQPVSLGVWVNSSVGGQVGVSLRNNSGGRSYVSMTSATAGVWTFCPVANIPGDTAGTWLTGAGQVGVNYSVTLMAGTGRQSATPNTWTSTNNITTSGQTQVTTTAGATFIITGLSLEPGATTNTFDRRPYPEEFGFCQRYYWKTFQPGTAPAQGGGVDSGELFQQGTGSGTVVRADVRFPYQMAKVGAATSYNPAIFNAQARDEGVGDCAGTNVAINQTVNGFQWAATTPGGGAIGDPIGVHVTVDAGV